MSAVFRHAGLRFWLITLAAGLGIAVTSSLGFWQLGRADTKLALQAQREAQAAAEPVGTADVLAALLAAPGAEPEGWRYRRVVLEGRWAARHTVYLDNRQMGGRPGFFVLTPLVLQEPRVAVLVQRGWVPRNFQDRTALPVIETPDGIVRIDAVLAGLPSRLYALEQGAASEGSSRIRQNLDLPAFRAETGLDLPEWSVVQSGAASEGLLRDWPVIASGVDKHYGYAFQWFGLSALMALLYVWFQIVRRFLRPRREPAT